MNSGLNLAAVLRTFALEQDCCLCDCPSTAPVCAECVAMFPPLPAEICPCCALPSSGALTCGRCLSIPPHFDATIAAFAYGDPLDGALQAFKYRHALGLTRFLSAQLDRALGATPPAPARLIAPRSIGTIDLIVPMPLTPSRLRERGFNQALELARPIARRRRIALDVQTVRRVRDTPPQAQLPWKERARNIKGVFACTSSAAARPALDVAASLAELQGLHIAVVDDVMTTGATLNELARVLKAAGAACVTNWVVARTLPHSFVHTSAPASA